MAEGKELGCTGGVVVSDGSRAVASMDCCKEEERWIAGSVEARLGERDGVRLKREISL